MPSMLTHRLLCFRTSGYVCIYSCLGGTGLALVSLGGKAVSAKLPIIRWSTK